MKGHLLEAWMMLHSLMSMSDRSFRPKLVWSWSMLFLTSHHWTWPFEWFHFWTKGYLSKFTYKQSPKRSKTGYWKGIWQKSWTDSQYRNKSTKLKWNSFLTFRSHFVTFQIKQLQWFFQFNFWLISRDLNFKF